MSRFKPGDKVRAVHPHDSVSGQLHDGEVKSVSSRRSPTNEEIEQVTVEFPDGTRALQDADWTEPRD